MNINNVFKLIIFELIMKKYFKKIGEYSLKTLAVGYIGVHAAAHLLPLFYLAGEHNEKIEAALENPVASTSFALTILGGMGYEFYHHKKQHKYLDKVKSENEVLKKRNNELESILSDKNLLDLN